MTKAVCISCGTIRSEVWDECDECGFNPERDEESQVKSYYLSTARYETAEELR